MDASLFDYDLPGGRIAQSPAEPRDASKLLLCRARGRLGRFSGPFEFSDHRFRDIESMLGAGDFLVMNDAKVLPVRIFGRRETGGAVEALLLRKKTGAEESSEDWTALLHLSAKIKPGLKLVFEPGLVAEVLSTHEERLASDGEVRLRFSGLALERAGAQRADERFERWLETHGHVPLPPYIERDDDASDKTRYQTVYARKSGSAAAPTAGFHFTPELLSRLEARGVRMGRITLHVGLGTFRPIKADQIEEHQMHEEIYEITPDFAEAYASARNEGRRIVAVGTTVVRALESWINPVPGADKAIGAPGIFVTRAYIRPGHAFKAVDDLITNFHLPRSTLLVLIAAAMGRGREEIENQRAAYAHALAQGYRFFSYGDAMFIRGKNNGGDE
ncbi:MAG: tRNA preQ1(34) S-adenosylmethionine ribosyltransferase-isomerase QueA [Deltaproteobacteria bacterium]|nr:tRNA preQ1(34) S-adenosylmethionine ribosyltransferase-isomerase QueA [Deltaproteobacteria bacterium]